jgi:hypothetical protein
MIGMPPMILGELWAFKASVASAIAALLGSVGQHQEAALSAAHCILMEALDELSPEEMSAARSDAQPRTGLANVEFDTPIGPRAPRVTDPVGLVDGKLAHRAPAPPLIHELGASLRAVAGVEEVADEIEERLNNVNLAPSPPKVTEHALGETAQPVPRWQQPKPVRVEPPRIGSEIKVHSDAGRVVEKARQIIEEHGPCFAEDILRIMAQDGFAMPLSAERPKVYLSGALYRSGLFAFRGAHGWWFKGRDAPGA